jgi:hypothetical protein
MAQPGRYSAGKLSLSPVHSPLGVGGYSMNGRRRGPDVPARVDGGGVRPVSLRRASGGRANRQRVAGTGSLDRVAVFSGRGSCLGRPSHPVGLILGLIHVRPPPSGRVRTAALMLVKTVPNSAGRPVAHLESERAAHSTTALGSSSAAGVANMRQRGETRGKPQVRRYMCAPL